MVFSLQVLEFLEEMSEQLNDPSNGELRLLKDLKVCTKPFFALFHFTPLIMLFSLIISIFTLNILTSGEGGRRCSIWHGRFVILHEKSRTAQG
jgi:hypothetical protein